MAVHDPRDSTTDVDSMSALDDELRSAVASVAEATGWDVDWLNDHAKSWKLGNGMGRQRWAAAPLVIERTVPAR